MSTVSTVPAAIETLAGYFQAVAAANPALEVGVYTGLPVETVNDNYIMIGSWDGGQDWILNYHSTWEALPSASQWIGEEYEIQCALRTYNGAPDLAGRLTDAFTLFNGVRQEIVNDPGGSANLSPSGSWGAVTVTMPACGPINKAGWGVVLSFNIGVINVRLT